MKLRRLSEILRCSDLERMFTIGVVTGAHGIKGDLRVFPSTGDTSIFEKLKIVTLETNTGTKEYELERAWFHKKYVMLKLKTVDTMNDALLLKGAQIKVMEKETAPLENDEYFYADLYDMEVFTETGELLGKITDIIETGANDVYEVDNNLYIPAIKKCIKQVDVLNKKMTVELLEGLR